MGLTLEIARYITNAQFDDFPSKAKFAARHGITDFMACALAGTMETVNGARYLNEPAPMPAWRRLPASAHQHIPR